MYNQFLNFYNKFSGTYAFNIYYQTLKDIFLRTDGFTNITYLKTGGAKIKEIQVYTFQI